MTEPMSRNRLLGSLKEAASWPGADQNTVMALAAGFGAFMSLGIVGLWLYRGGKHRARSSR